MVRMEVSGGEDSSNVIVEINSNEEGNKIGITEIRKLSSMQIDSIKFHKQKLVFLRASVRSYAEELKTKGFEVEILPFEKNKMRSWEDERLRSSKLKG